MTTFVNRVGVLWAGCKNLATETSAPSLAVRKITCLCICASVSLPFRWEARLTSNVESYLRRTRNAVDSTRSS